MSIFKRVIECGVHDWFCVCLQWRSDGVRTAPGPGGKRAKIVYKKSRENSDIVSFVCVCVQ